MPILPSPSASPRTTTPSDIVERWVQLQEEMNHLNHTPSSVGSSSVGLSSTRPTVKPSRRTKSATSPYRQQPVESLSVSFAKLLVNQINGASPSTSTTPKRSKKNKNKKKQPRFNDPPVRITIRNNKPVTEVRQLNILIFVSLFNFYNLFVLIDRKHRLIMWKNGFNTAVLIMPGGASWPHLLPILPVAETRRPTIGLVVTRLLAKASWSIIRSLNTSRPQDVFCGFNLRAIRLSVQVAAILKCRLHPLAGFIEFESNNNL